MRLAVSLWLLEILIPFLVTYLYAPLFIILGDKNNYFALFCFYLSLKVIIDPFNKLLQWAGHGAKWFSCIILNKFNIIIIYVIFIYFMQL